jgi:hypothetical protein
MNIFGCYEKNSVVAAIESLAEYEKSLGKTPVEIAESVLEATSYGVKYVLIELLKSD